MAAKLITSFQTPLDTFLASAFGKYDSGLTYLAQEFAAKPFNAASFRRDLLAKLKRLRYPQPDRLEDDKTFYEMLRNARVLGVLMRRATLHALWKCILLRKVVEWERELERAGKAVTGKPLKEHRRQARTAKRDLAAIERLQESYKAPGSADGLHSKVTREFRNHLTDLIISTKYRGSRAELLTGSPKTGARGVPKSELLASNIAIYRILEQALQPDTPNKRKLSGIFLCQLSELISAEPNVQASGDGVALSKALERSQK